MRDVVEFVGNPEDMIASRRGDFFDPVQSARHGGHRNVRGFRHVTNGGALQQRFRKRLAVVRAVSKAFAPNSDLCGFCVNGYIAKLTLQPDTASGSFSGRFGGLSGGQGIGRVGGARKGVAVAVERLERRRIGRPARREVHRVDRAVRPVLDEQRPLVFRRELRPRAEHHARRAADADRGEQVDDPQPVSLSVRCERSKLAALESKGERFALAYYTADELA